jgi:hypothetical protein
MEHACIVVSLLKITWGNPRWLIPCRQGKMSSDVVDLAVNYFYGHIGKKKKKTVFGDAPEQLQPLKCHFFLSGNVWNGNCSIFSKKK